MLTVTVNPSLDTTATADRVDPDQKVRCTAVHHDPGGGGINVARAATELGAEATALWTKGGSFGQAIQELLDDEGVLHDAVEISANTRQSFTVIESEGEQRHFRFSTPGPALSDDERSDLRGRIRSHRADLLVLSGGLAPGMPSSTYAEIAEEAAGSGARVVLDTHGTELREALDGGHVFLVKPNLRELATVTGGKAIESEMVEAARRLIDSGATEVVVLSLGDRGAALVHDDGAWRIDAPEVDVASKVGAGDSMVGGLVAQISAGADLDDAVRYGVAAGAAAVTTPGTQLCTRRTTEDLLPLIELVPY